jgi:predicted nucleic acid-binding protein
LIGVINASPLIYLAKLGVLRLLSQLFSEIWTSREVREEVLRNKREPEVPLLEEAFSNWLKVYSLRDASLLIKLKKLNIHAGEATVIAIARELKDMKQEAITIIDDLAAREIARTLEISVIGTVGTLLQGVKEKLISKEQCKDYFLRLIEETDFRMNVKLYAQLLKRLESI